MILYFTAYKTNPRLKSELYRIEIKSKDKICTPKKNVCSASSYKEVSCPNWRYLSVQVLHLSSTSLVDFAQWL